MPRSQPEILTVPFPLGGLDRRLAFDRQKNGTTALCLNIWPTDSPSGRERGGVRPPCKSIGSVGTDVVSYNWCRGSYDDSGTVIVSCVTTDAGTVVSSNGTNWATITGIGTAPGSLTFPQTASCAFYKSTLYQALSGAECKQKAMPGGGTVALSNAGGGTAPTKCGIVLHHEDRLWLMNQSDAPHVVYASAVGDATNWDTTDPTDGGAYTNTGSEGGVLGEPVVAGISHNGVLYFGGPTSVYVVQGNPKVSGCRRIGFNIGPVMNTAWCVGPDQFVYMVTPDGLYRIGPSSQEPEQLSRMIMPNELMGINPFNGDIVCIGYDERWRGLMIYVNPNTGSDTAWFYKLPDGEFPGSFWPMALPESMRLMVTFPELISGDTSSVLPIAADGTVYQFDRSYADEDFDSYLFIGPIYLGDGGSEGMLQAIAASLAENSDQVNWEVYSGDSAESAYQSADPPEDNDFEHSFSSKAPHFVGEPWTQERFNHWQHPRCRAHVIYLKIFDEGNESWLLESIVIRRKVLGLRRAH